MAIYTAYSDEAGIADPSGEFLVCGYLGTESTWCHVRQAWQERVLDGPPKIVELHMTDIRSGYWRAEVGMTFNDSENRVAEAVRVIRSTGALDAVASVIKRSMLYEVFPKQTKNKKPTGLDIPDYVCCMAYIQLVLGRIHKLHPDATRVNFVFAEKQATKKGMENIVESARRFFAAEEPEISAIFGDCRMDVIPEKEIGLQAADLISWHLQCNYRGNFPRTDENRMWYLLKERDGDLHEWSTALLQDFAAAIMSHR